MSDPVEMNSLIPVSVPFGDGSAWIGKNMFIRTVTHYAVGRFERVEVIGGVTPFVVLSDAAWIANTGRLGQALGTPDALSETEPFPSGTCLYVNLTAAVGFIQYMHPIECYRNPKPR